MTLCYRTRPYRHLSALSVLVTAAGLSVLFAWPAGAAAPVRSAADPVTVAVGQFPAAIAADPGTGTAYDANAGNDQAVHGTGTLSIVHGTDVSTVHLGGTPTGVAVDTTTHTVYVPVANSHSKLVVFAPGGRFSVPLSNPGAIAVDSTTATAWVLEAPNLLVKVVGKTETVYSVQGIFTDYVAVDPVTHTALVLSVDGVLTHVQPDGTVWAQYLSPSAAALAVDSGHGTVYVAHSSYFENGVSHPALLSALTGFGLRVVDLGSDVFVGGLAVDEATGTAAATESNS